MWLIREAIELNNGEIYKRAHFCMSLILWNF
jgi:hypothetical protein